MEPSNCLGFGAIAPDDTYASELQTALLAFKATIPYFQQALNLSSDSKEWSLFSNLTCLNIPLPGISYDPLQTVSLEILNLTTPRLSTWRNVYCDDESGSWWLNLTSVPLGGMQFMQMVSKA